MKNIHKVLLSLALLVPSAAPASAISLIHHRPAVVATSTHKKSFVRRHPIITAIGAAAVIHHFAKHHH